MQAFEYFIIEFLGKNKKRESGVSQFQKLFVSIDNLTKTNQAKIFLKDFYN